MSTLLKEVFREMIKNGNSETAEDLHSYLKDMFTCITGSNQLETAKKT